MEGDVPRAARAGTRPHALRDGGVAADGHAVWAGASLSGETVSVAVPEGFAPAKVRFAWDDYPVCNLVNGKVIPAESADGFAVVDLPPSRRTAIRLDLNMRLVRKTHDIGGRPYTEFSFGPLVLVRDTGLGDSLGEALPDDLSFKRQDCGDEAFAKFAATDAGGRRHNLVDYAQSCRANPDADEFEVFIPAREP